MDTFFSPFGKEYCAYFYWLTVLAFILLILAVYRSLILLFKFKSKTQFLGLLLSLFGPFLLYFNNRLLYSMCVR